MDFVSKEEAYQILMDDADKVYHLIASQKEHLCFATCPAFEEVVDTHLYGLSKQVEFAIQLGIIEREEGHRILSDLETSLNDMYNRYYEQSKSNQHVKRNEL